MHDLAENGIAAHWRYKDDAPPAPMKEDRRLHWLREMAALFEEKKNPQEFLRSLKIQPDSRRGLRLHAQGQGRRPPGRRHGPGLRLQDPHRGRPPRRRGPRQRDGGPPQDRAQDRRHRRDPDRSRQIADARPASPRRRRRARASSSAAGSTSAAARRAPRSAGSSGRRKRRSTTCRPGCAARQELAAQARGPARPSGRVPGRVLPPGGTRPHRPRPRLRRVGLRTRRAAPSGPRRQDRGPVSCPVRDRECGSRTSTVMMIKLAKCCSPVKGEPVVGYITAGRGLTVHSLRCPLVAKEVLDGQRLVEVSWDPSFAGTFKARLLVKTQDTPGRPGQGGHGGRRARGGYLQGGGIHGLGGKARITLDIRIRDIRHLEDISRRIAGLKEVVSVERV
ncbi:MAG: hypothetical protein MZU95_13075 [Desulfomicrobium escambiense]|nr:hypothetical protein [Desulfomicrobium escambiense]